MRQEFEFVGDAVERQVFNQVMGVPLKEAKLPDLPCADGSIENGHVIVRLLVEGNEFCSQLREACILDFLLGALADVAQKGRNQKLSCSSHLILITKQ